MKKEAPRDDSSSGEEDGDEDWRSAINSVAVDASAPSFAVVTSQKTRKKNHGKGDDIHFDSDEEEGAKQRPPNPHKQKVHMIPLLLSSPSFSFCMYVQARYIFLDRAYLHNFISSCSRFHMFSCLKVY